MKIIKNLNIITDKDIEQYLSSSGIGACGSVSKVLSEYSYGKIMVGTFQICITSSIIFMGFFKTITSFLSKF